MATKGPSAEARRLVSALTSAAVRNAEYQYIRANDDDCISDKERSIAAKKYKEARNLLLDHLAKLEGMGRLSQGMHSSKEMG